MSPLVWQNALLTFLLSIALGAVLGFIAQMPFVFSLLLLLVIICVGILFDMVGVAVAAANEKPLHAMGADRIHGSRQAIWLIRRAGRVSNICNDVVGDVCGTISGAITAGLAIALAVRYSLDHNLLSILVIAVIAALTVGGKAIGKIYALREPHLVVLAVGRILAWFGLSGGKRDGRARQARAGRGPGRR
ncbi:MAG: hypothetical protein ACM3ZC_04605 [Bacteroidota bacterium]